MLKIYPQMSLFDIYNDVRSAMENNKPKLIKLLETYIDLSVLIPLDFYRAFYLNYGRKRKYDLEGFLKFFLLQKVLGVQTDSGMLSFLLLSREMRDYCGFRKVPDASKITRFKHVFLKYIKLMFDKCVDITEPICREINAKKADYLIYDTTGILANVAENNPKFINAKLKSAKKYASKNPGFNAYAYAYSSMPDNAAANPFVQQQYINGHFCYAHKAVVITNGLGVVREITFLDDDFKRRHPEIVSKKSDNPDLDKEVGDSISLNPVLTDFFDLHPSFSYRTFLGDSAFDSYNTYSMLRNDFGFDRMCIPLNTRNSTGAHKDFDNNGVPLCPTDKTPFTFLGTCGGKNRSKRFKWVCHQSKPVGKSAKRVCSCESPCTNSTYGRCVYTYPDKDLRLYPGIPRGTEHWDNLYRHRTLVERSIYLLKDPLAGENLKSFSVSAANASLLFAGMVQLLGVIIAHAIKKPELYKSIRKLTAA